MDAAADSGDGVGDELLPELAAAASKGAPRPANELASGMVASAATVGGSRW